MAYWEFLLQKEGDRDWLPLETAHVEISEGRYRIIAHTSYCQATVEIYLSQLLAEAVPPRRKVRKRFGQTTENGLMVVIPFTHLTAGSWTVRCTGVSSKDETAATDWEYGVQLQVLSVESGLDYWDADLEEAEPVTEPTSENFVIDGLQLPFPANKQTEASMDDAIASSNTIFSGSLETPPSSVVSNTRASTADSAASADSTFPASMQRLLKTYPSDCSSSIKPSWLSRKLHSRYKDRLRLFLR